MNFLENTEIQINEIKNVLDTEVNFDEQLCKNVVLVVGITGGGKSTVCQFLANNPKLRAVRIGEASDYYITDSDDKISDFTTISKTNLPELVPIPNTNTVLADCPGFSDSRSMKHDIGAAVFTKQLLDKSETVKIMMTTSYHTVQKSADRTNFINLLIHIGHFIDDIEKYRDSVGLIVTKVDNRAEPNEEGILEYIADSRLINSIGTFLSVVKNEINMKLNDYGNMEPKMLQLLDILLKKNGDNVYSKISIFRKPIVAGLLSTQKKLQDSKETIYTVINSIQFTRVSQHDFGLSPSKDSKFIVTKMQKTIATELLTLLDDYLNLVSQQLLASDPKLLTKTKAILSRTSDVIGLLEKDLVPEMVLTELLGQIEIIALPEDPAQYYTNLKRQQKYMSMLNSICPAEDARNDFQKYGRRLQLFKDTLHVNIQLIGQLVEKSIDQLISDSFTNIITSVKDETINLELTPQRSYSKMAGQLEAVHDSYEQFKTRNQLIGNLTLKKLLQEFLQTFKISESEKQKLKSLDQDIDFFKNHLQLNITDGHQDHWTRGFPMALDVMKKQADWYAFIANTYFVLLDYANQDALKNNTLNLKNWPHFKTFMQKFDLNNSQRKKLNSRHTLSVREQSDLEKLIDTINSLLSNEYSYECLADKLIIKRSVVKLSDVKTKYIPQCPLFEELYLFATHSVIFDDSLIASSKNVYIVAPIWDIRGAQLVDLRGLDGSSYQQAAEQQHGLAGKPGMPGGNFIGISERVLHNNELTIDVSGGAGGNGQDGRSGEDVGPGGDGGKPGLGGKHGTIVFDKTINIKRNHGNDGIGGKGGKGYKVCNYGSNIDYSDAYVYLKNGESGVAGINQPAKLPKSYESLATVAGTYKQYAQSKVTLFADPLQFINRYTSKNRKRRSLQVAPGSGRYPWDISPLGIEQQTGNHGNQLNTFWNTQFSLSSFVTLADVLIRKFKKTESKIGQSHMDPDWENLLVQAEVLNIVEKCEIKWNEMNQHNTVETPFDPLCMQKELKKRINRMTIR